MFTQMKNIDSAFRYVRGFCMLLILVTTVIGCYSIYKSFQMVNQVQARVYVLSNGKVLEAFAAERKENIPVEAKDHIKTFHIYFFSQDPDDKVIAANMRKALYLADASAKRQYDNLRESGYYTNLIASNISQTISIDSVNLDINQIPYHFRCYGVQQIIRSTSTVTRTLITEGYLRNVARSENNPHGFLIERWETIENRDIKVQSR